MRLSTAVRVGPNSRVIGGRLTVLASETTPPGRANDRVTSTPRDRRWA